MSETLRLYKYKSLLTGKTALSAAQLSERMEISRATLKRDLAKMRDQFHLPVYFDRERRGYALREDGQARELPGLWLEPQELAALSALEHLTTQLQPGLVGRKLQALGGTLATMMRQPGVESVPGAGPTLVLPTRKQSIDTAILDTVCAATVGRHRLRVVWVDPQSQEALTQELSPQQIVLYRDNWHLAAYCHGRETLITVPVGALQKAQTLDQRAHTCESGEVKEMVSAAYGLGHGLPKEWAVLRFSSVHARQVGQETWHARQTQRWLPDGGLEMRLPYADAKELIQDILSYGAGVVVVAPTALRQQVQKILLESVARYIDSALPWQPGNT